MRALGLLLATIVAAAVVSFLVVYLSFELIPEGSILLIILALVLTFLVVGIVVPAIAGWRIGGSNARLRILGVPAVSVGQAGAYALGIIASGNSFEEPTTIVVIGLLALVSSGYSYAVHPRQ